MTVTVEYDSNNSGGDWWLTDDDWRALEAAGWKVQWFAEEGNSFFKPDAEGRWLRALATTATKEFPSLRDGIREWENITGESAAALGCNCCGPPHNFYGRDPETGKSVDSYSPDPPLYGDSYE